MKVACKTHPWLAQKVCTRSGHAAVSAGALLNKALNMCRKRAGEFLHDGCAINAMKLANSNIIHSCYTIHVALYLSTRAYLC